MKIFLHGLESSSRGAKATFLRGLYPDMVIPDFSGGLGERMALLRTLLAGQKHVKLVGSSFGGLQAVIFALENSTIVERVILLAPALNFPEFSGYRLKRLGMPARLIIGRNDTVTPVQKVVPIARNIFTALHYEIVDDDHLLAKTFRTLGWKKLLTG